MIGEEQIQRGKGEDLEFSLIIEMYESSSSKITIYLKQEKNPIPRQIKVKLYIIKTNKRTRQFVKK